MKPDCQSIRLTAMASLKWAVWATLGLGVLSLLPGCGTPGAPQPPSLGLPGLVQDLSAIRAGTAVKLKWTMPRRNTDRTMIKHEVPVRICRSQAENTSCDPVGPDQMTPPGAEGEYTDNLPTELARGPARRIRYFVELRNKRERSAGLSNPAVVLAGAAPAPIEGLKAEVTKPGVVLSWTGNDESSAVRLERELLTSNPKTDHGLLSAPSEPKSQNLLVQPGKQSRAMDTGVRVGESYQYRAQRVVRLDENGKALELDGAFSPWVLVNVQDVFPPAVPTGLVAISIEGRDGAGGPSIDLSWQPDTDPKLVGYAVYRAEEGNDWQRISKEPPTITPAFHDATVQAGHRYRYVVTAVDKNGHESARSAEAQETVPQP